MILKATLIIYSILLVKTVNILPDCNRLTKSTACINMFTVTKFRVEVNRIIYVK
jgi:hypothetical protein